jgi:two-component system, NtrC family, sensor kinase
MDDKERKSVMPFDKQNRSPEETFKALQEELAAVKRSKKRLQKIVDNLGTRNEYLLTLHEKSLLVSEREFDAIFESVKEGFYRTDDQGRIVMANTVAVKMLGYDSINEAKGIYMIDLYDNPADRDVLLEQIFKQGRVSAYEVAMKKKDGQIITVLINAHVRHSDTGEFIGIQGTVVDISHRKYQETEHFHSQKLAAIGSLAAGIAHEINTPVQYVRDNTTFIQDSFNGVIRVLDASSRLVEIIQKNRSATVTQKAVEDLAAAMDEADLPYLKEEIPLALEQSLDGLGKVSRIVRSMKEFSHPGGDAWELADINHTLDNTITVARNEWKYVATIKQDFEETLPLVKCNPGELSQVFLNMIINASHAILEGLGEDSSGKGIITIVTRSRGAWVEIQISDTGSGIPEKLQSQIFDPFFTTKEVGRGTGQGLAISHSVVVDKHKGKIWIQTSSEKGSCFIIQLPVNGPEKSTL